MVRARVRTYVHVYHGHPRRFDLVAENRVTLQGNEWTSLLVAQCFIVHTLLTR
jgi:hypothetical protein